MKTEIFAAVLLPFLGTALGSAGVFILKDDGHRPLQGSLAGFAAGVMTAASVWSLLIPAIEQTSHVGRFAFLPAFAGVWGGFLFLMLLDHILPCRNITICNVMAPAMALHNIPEGMAAGVAAAGWLSGSTNVSAATALTLAIGIALQNLPEGAIVSLSLHQSGVNRLKAFTIGMLSGAVEPAGAVVTILLTDLVVSALPALLSFSAGAMLFVVVHKLIPGMSQQEHSGAGVILFAAGFTLMMLLGTVAG